MNFRFDVIENRQCRVLHFDDRRVDLQNDLFHGVIHDFDDIGDCSTHLHFHAISLRTRMKKKTTSNDLARLRDLFFSLFFSSLFLRLVRVS